MQTATKAQIKQKIQIRQQQNKKLPLIIQKDLQSSIKDQLFSNRDDKNSQKQQKTKEKQQKTKEKLQNTKEKPVLSLSQQSQRNHAQTDLQLQQGKLNTHKQVFFLKRLQVIAISDNHGDYKSMNKILKLKGDIFIHAGDFTYHSKEQDIQKFIIFLDKIQFKHKIVIAGNHEQVLSINKINNKYIQTKNNNKTSLTNDKISRQYVLKQFKKRSIHYLEHQALQIEGIKIFGSPYTPIYCKKPKGRAFQYAQQYDEAIWSGIPQDIDFLITHGPPFGVLDHTKQGKKAGSKHLKVLVDKIRPKYHVFGHIHQGTGMNKIGQTMFLNVSNNPTRIIL